MMKLISLFDGIGGFPLAWANVTGQAPADLHYQSSEIEPWPMAVVRQRFPNVEELGDVTGIQGDRLRSGDVARSNGDIPDQSNDATSGREYDLDVHFGKRQAQGDKYSTAQFVIDDNDQGDMGDDFIITFGSPCQDLSSAGKQQGLDGERSGLFHEAMRLVRDIRPRPKYFIWENVAGAFSSNNGNDFAAVLQSTADIGYDAVWTTLDAQWCGVPQRRRRVFLLGVRDRIPAGADIFSFGRRATDLCRDKVQLIRDSRSRNTATSGEARPVAAALTADGVGTCGADDNQGQAGHLVMQPRYARNGRGAPDVVSSPLDAEGGATSDKRQIVATGVAETLQTTCNDYSRADGFNMITEITHAAPAAPVIRRLTPVECLRLQGFPDDWFEGVPGYSDTKAYRAVGNSVAIPCVEWIFQQVLKFDKTQE